MTFLKGFLAGVLFAITLGAFAASIVGSNGYVMGWSVTKDGEEICSDPFIWTATREIECD